MASVRHKQENPHTAEPVQASCGQRWIVLSLFLSEGCLNGFLTTGVVEAAAGT